MTVGSSKAAEDSTGDAREVQDESLANLKSLTADK